MTDSTGTEDAGRHEHPPTSVIGLIHHVFTTFATSFKAVVNFCVLLIALGAALSLAAGALSGHRGVFVAVGVAAAGASTAACRRALQWFAQRRNSNE